MGVAGGSLYLNGSGNYLSKLSDYSYKLEAMFGDSNKSNSNVYCSWVSFSGNRCCYPSQLTLPVENPAVGNMRS